MKPRGGPVDPLPKVPGSRMHPLETIRDDVVIGNDPVKNPKHYQDTEVFCPACGEELETIDVIQNKGYILGNILKYLFRFD